MFILFRPFANFKKLLSFYVCFLQKKGNILMESDNTGSVCDECEQDIRTEIAKIRTVQNELSRKTDRLLINHEEMQKRLSQVEEKMEDTSCVVDELYGFIDDMDDSIEKLKSEQEELCTCTDDLESEYKDLDDSLQSAHQRIDDLKQDSSFSIECVQRLYTSLSGSLSNASEEITYLQAFAYECREFIEDIVIRLSEIEKKRVCYDYSQDYPTLFGKVRTPSPCSVLNNDPEGLWGNILGIRNCLTYWLLNYSSITKSFEYSQELYEQSLMLSESLRKMLPGNDDGPDKDSSLPF